MSTENLKVIITGDASDLDQASTKATAAVNKVSQSAAEWDRRARQLNQQINYTSRATKEMATSAAGAAQKVAITTHEIESSSRALQQMNRSSSSATNSLFALSGIVQDAPYGFRAIANNITFFTQEMAYSAKASGGFGAALKAMGGAFLGPAGIIFAISAGVSLLDTFFSSTGKASQKVDQLATKIKDLRDGLKTLTDIQGDTTKATSEQSSKLELLYNAATDVTRSQAERLKAAKDLQTSFPKTFGNLSQIKIISGQAAGAFQTLSDNILKVAKASVILKDVEANIKKIGDAQTAVNKAIDKNAFAKLTKDYVDAKKKLDEAKSTVQVTGAGAFGGANPAASAQSTFNAANDALNAYTKTINGYRDVIRDAEADNKKLNDSFNALDFKDKKGGGGDGKGLKTISGLLGEIKTKFAAVDTLAKALNQSQEQIATEKIAILYSYLQKIADIGGPGAVKAIKNVVEQASQIKTEAFLPTLTGGRTGVNASGIGAPGIPSRINPNIEGLSPNAEKIAREKQQAFSPFLLQLNKMGIISDRVFADMNVKISKNIGATNVLASGFENIFSAIANGGNPFQALIQSVEQLVIKLAAAAAAVALLNLIPGGSAVLGVLDLVSKTSSFAGGGFIPSPQLAVVGDAPGGEWVLNQKQISAILNGSGGGRNIHVTGTLIGEGSQLKAVIDTTGRKQGRRG